MAVQTDFEVILPNRPGAAAEVGEAMGAAGINIDGACAHGSGDDGVIHVLVEGDATSAREALRAHGLKVAAERSAVVVPCADEPGELGRVLRRIATADVNVVALYLTTSGQLVICVEEPEHITGLLT